MVSRETKPPPSASAFAPSPPLSARSGGTSDCESDARAQEDDGAVSAAAPQKEPDLRRRGQLRRQQARPDSSPASPTSVQPRSLPSAGSSFTTASGQDAPSLPTLDVDACSRPGRKGSARGARGAEEALYGHGLCSVLRFLDQLRRGQHPTSPGRESVDFALNPTSEYPAFRELLLGLPQTRLEARSTLDPNLQGKLNVDLDRLGRWAQDHLRWDYDPRRALLTIRMLSPVHQDVLDKLKDLLVARFRAALARSGRGGAIHARAGIEYIFTEPQAEPQLESAPRPRRHSLPRRTRPGRDNREPEVAAPRGESSRAGAAETSPPPSPSPGHEGEGPTGHETVSSPDVGLFYTPAGGTENYFPGFVLEVGYSHPLEDAAAKRYIRYSNGLVGYVMAFNVQYDRARQNRNIFITAHRLAWTEDAWFPEKCLNAYNVRARAAALGPDEAATAEVDLGLRLSHLHDTLLPQEEGDDGAGVPITLPLRALIHIVDEAYKVQDLHDQYKHDSQQRLAPRPSLIGKRARTATPPADLLQNPDAAYVDREAAASRVSSKRRRTGTRTGTGTGT